jgi:hypothetical protein
MFIEPGSQRTFSLQRSEIFGWRGSTLRASGAKDVLPNASAINIWPRCGLGARPGLLLEL